MSHSKDFSSVSPSAKSLLLMKGLTNIPYARQMAELMQGPEVFDFDFRHKDFWFWIRVLHFESRYWSIDQLLKKTDAKNILELSSGFSLRGIDMCTGNAELYYIDTDLDGVIATKQQLIGEIMATGEIPETYKLLPLNALDGEAFSAVVAQFPPGPVTIVNEGLLMYLNLDEKIQLCGLIHTVLKERGGSWITADVYVKRDAAIIAKMPQSQSEKEFMTQHQVEENKFDSYEAAATFFRSLGFDIVAEAVPDLGSMSVLPELMKVMPEEVRNSKEPPPKIQATWMLKAK